MTRRAPSSPAEREAFADFGDDDAGRWEAIAHHYTAPLCGYFSKRVRNPADVDDLIQEVFVQLLRRSRGKPIERVHQYLFQVAANVLRDQGRRRQARRLDEHESYDEERHEFATEISPERVLLGEDAVARVATALQRLPQRTQDVFFLRAIDRCKFKDIARKLGVSLSTVEKEMADAILYLHEKLNR
jgi:RNA polymerase sigma-70 factor (ECF subfamily)